MALRVNEIVSWKHYPAELRTLEDALDVADRMFRWVARAGSEEYKARPSLQGVHLLFMRSLELMRNSYWCLLTGSYGTSKALSRLVLENSELSLLFSKDDKFIRKWMQKKQFSPGFVRASLYRGEDLADASRFYGRLSDYVHPNVIGWTEYLKTSNQAQMFGSPLYPVFDVKAARESIVVLAYSTRVMFASVWSSFGTWLSRISDDLDSLLKRLDLILPHV